MGIFQISVLVAICFSSTQGLIYNPNPDPGQPIYSLESLYGPLDSVFGIFSRLNDIINDTPARDANGGLSALAAGIAYGLANGINDAENPYQERANEYYSIPPEDRPSMRNSLLRVIRGGPKSARGGLGAVLGFFKDVAKAARSGKPVGEASFDIGKSFLARARQFGVKTFEPIAGPEIDLAGSFGTLYPYIFTQIFAVLLQPLISLLSVLGNFFANNANDARGPNVEQFPTPTPNVVNPPDYTDPLWLSSFFPTQIFNV